MAAVAGASRRHNEAYKNFRRSGAIQPARDGTFPPQGLDVTVGTDGHVKDVAVRKSIPELDAAAVAAIRQWEFKPGRAKGKPVDVVCTVTIAFTLK